VQNILSRFKAEWAFGSQFGFGSVPSVIDEEPIISVLGYFGSVPVLTELAEFFQKTSRQQ
jgi:hypothetical protein